MTIPLLDNDGKLPFGVWPCTYHELEARFGQTRRRRELLRELRRLLADLERRAISGSVLINGSFVTSEPAPHDIDILVVVPPALYRARRKELEALRSRAKPQLDVFIVPERSLAGRELIATFSEGSVPDSGRGSGCPSPDRPLGLPDRPLLPCPRGAA
ncbi:MAG: hypothetical protein KGJ23_10000, partial [Euryarchaeota archaeon]|nr:hypothetical protein [Euryarchaeota archaeon]